jgi:succinate dehydrogenase/fumarate reductase flavoprotein subunit
MAHKNMGGVAIDLKAQVLNHQHTPIPGLYAAGEITGSAGINGLAGLDGTFTGPSILIGRVAGRSAAAHVNASQAQPNRTSVESAPPKDTEKSAAATAPWSPTMDAAQLAELLRTPRDGYWHFEQVHRSVLQRQYACTQCHSALVPQSAIQEREGWRALAETCDNCHLAPAPR